MILLELLVGVALTVSTVTVLLFLAEIRMLEKKIRTLQFDRDHDRKQMQAMQVRVRDMKTKFDRFIYVPKNDRR